LAELVRALRTEYAGMESGDNASADEDVWTLIALFDLREEADTGLLVIYLSRLENALK
jgi:hypothetical protein